MPDDFLNKITRLADKTDEVIEKALEAGGEIAYTAVLGNLHGAIGSNTIRDSQSTGELIGSLGVSPVKISNSGISNVKVGFNEPRRQQNKAKGKRSYQIRTNAMIANVLEHGRHGQPPRPFMKSARNSAKSACIDAMKAVIESAVNSL